MNTKNLGIFFLAIASILVLMTFTSAAKSDLVTIDQVKINGIDYGYSSESIGIDAGENILVEVYFTAQEDASDVRFSGDVEGDEVDTGSKTSRFNLEKDKRYVKTISIKAPYELDEKASDDLALNLKIYNGDYKTEFEEVNLRVQRPSYNLDFMSIETEDSVKAGQKIPVDIVMKNIGYNTLDDLYVTISSSTLGISKSSYVGDLVSLEDNTDKNDEEDNIRKRFYIEVPYDAAQDTHTLEVVAENDDIKASSKKQISVSNEFSEEVLVSDSKKIVKKGDTANYELMIINPTDSLKVYRVDINADNLFADTRNSLISVPAGSTRTLGVTAKAESEGSYDFSVDLFSGENLEKTVDLELEAEDGFNGTNATFVLTVILVIIFVVLLVMLIVLLGKKPNKEEEEFGESYY